MKKKISNFVCTVMSKKHSAEIFSKILFICAIIFAIHAASLALEGGIIQAEHSYDSLQNATVIGSIAFFGYICIVKQRDGREN